MRGGLFVRRRHRVASLPGDGELNRMRYRDPAASCCTSTSLPGGRLGREAYRFVDWLAGAGQSWWPMLPLGAARRLGSPYAARPRSPPGPGCSAAGRARSRPPRSSRSSPGSASGSATGRRFAGAGAVADQVRFEREWGALRALRGRPRRPPVRRRPDLRRDRRRRRRARTRSSSSTGVVAGVPPDGLSAHGQLWGNPLYDWRALRAEGFRWWIERFRRTFELSTSRGSTTSAASSPTGPSPGGTGPRKRGRWRAGPGAELFRAAAASSGRSRSSPRTSG